jgi:hypothetical protein
MSVRNISRNTEIVRRHQAGEALSSIGRSLGLTQKRTYNIYTAELTRVEKAPKPVKVATPASKIAAAQIEKPNYGESLIRQARGTNAQTDSYQPPMLLQVNALRAKAVYPHPLLSCASRVIDGWGP